MFKWELENEKDALIGYNNHRITRAAVFKVCVGCSHELWRFVFGFSFDEKQRGSDGVKGSYHMANGEKLWTS